MIKANLLCKSEMTVISSVKTRYAEKHFKKPLLSGDLIFIRIKIHEVKTTNNDSENT
jgi:hypothetical protein